MAYAGKSDPDMTPQWEPSAEAVEALRAEWSRSHYDASLDGFARFILRRQHARELALREATRMAVIRAFETDTYSGWSDGMVKLRMDAYDAAHAKLDAPKVPTLLALVEAFDAAHGGVSGREKLDALDAIRAYAKAAVEREEREKR